MRQELDRRQKQALLAVEEKRSQNMRQLLLRASRIVNRNIVDGLRARGYSGLRSTHTTLLSNIDLGGSSVTEAAERAGITKQAMGRLASELEETGYIRIETDPRDARVRVLRFTAQGTKLMLDSFDVMAGLESRYANMIGDKPLTAILRGLSAFIAQAEKL
jgi:DNA-binding MarR family transcriptional regulator